ncbi:uncharacterized protein LOC135223289 [Macrobrachium nipponense]|uniref:uncharacterized protein LOC135223289 n=1 Tax=Macrobrachium nipponense TaxID=159736 RepID=UPI0030C89B02
MDYLEDLVNPLFDNAENSSLATFLRAMRFSLLQFNNIHSHLIFKLQLPNAHETYLPIALQWGLRNEVDLNYLFVTDFSDTHGTLDDADGIHKPKVFIIYGGELDGKTALVHYLAYQWLIDQANDVKKIKDFDLVMVVDPGDIETLNSLELLSLLELKLQLAYLPKSMTFEGIKNELKTLKILWLFDGFEDTTDGEKAIILDAIKNFPASQVVVVIDRNQEVAIRRLVESSQVKYVSLNFMALTSQTWRRMVPRMIATKTYDLQFNESLSLRFIRFFRGILDSDENLSPDVLGHTIEAWLMATYPIVAKCGQAVIGRGKSNQAMSHM